MPAGSGSSPTSGAPPAIASCRWPSQGSRPSGIAARSLPTASRVMVRASPSRWIRSLAQLLGAGPGTPDRCRRRLPSATWPSAAAAARALVAETLAGEGLLVARWRIVAGRSGRPGRERRRQRARASSRPSSRGRTAGRPSGSSSALVVARRRAETAARDQAVAARDPVRVRATRRLQGARGGRPAGDFYPDLAAPLPSAMRCSTSAMRRTPIPSGGSPSRSAGSPTTARSTPSAATASSSGAGPPTPARAPPRAGSPPADRCSHRMARTRRPSMRPSSCSS